MAWGPFNAGGSGSPGGQKEPLGLAQGGTGATTATQARQNLGAAASSHTHDDRYYPNRKSMRN